MPEPEHNFCVCTEKDKIDRIYNAIVGDTEKPGLRAMMAEQQNTTRHLNDITEKLTGIIVGNGDVGLDERVRTIEAARKRDDEAQKKASLRFWGICMLLLGNIAWWVRGKLS